MAVNLNQQNPNNPQGQQQDQQAAGQQFKPRTTGFTNLQRVLGANKNNQLGQTIGQGVQNITNKTQGQTQTAQQNFAKDIGQSVEDIKSGTKVKENLSNLDFTKDPNEAANKIQEVGGDQYAATTANLRRGYQGPQGLQNESQLQNQAQQLGQTAQGLLTQGGRQAALQRFVNTGPNYTQGKQQLDNMLLGQNQQAITQARRNAAQTAAGTNEALQKASQEGQFTGQQYNTLGQDVNQQIQGLGQNLTGALDTRASNLTQQAQTQVNDLKSALAKGELDRNQYQTLMTQVLNNDANTYLADPSALFSANTDYNRSNVAQQNEVGARDALSRLAGLQSGDQMLDLNEAQAGTAGPAIKTDANNLAKLAQQKQEAQKALDAFKFGSYATPGSTASFGSGGFSSTPSGFNVFKSGQGTGTINADEAKQILDLAGPNYKYGMANSSAMIPMMQPTVQTLLQQGKLGYDPNQSGYMYLNNALNSLKNQYGQLETNYGVGKNITNMLENYNKKNNTFGVK